MEYPFVNIHTHRRTGEGIELVSAMALSGVLPERPCSVGIHPWHAGGNGRGDNITVNPVNDIEAVLREVETADADAIGEIGLDYYRPVPRTLQSEVFEAQLKIAERRRLPVILHCVRAFEPVMKILRSYELPAVIFHGFVGSAEQVRRAVDSGYYLSFGRRSFDSRRTAAATGFVPLTQMFLETDEDEIPVATIYDEAAKLLGRDVGELKRAIYGNYIKIFGK